MVCRGSPLDVGHPGGVALQEGAQQLEAVQRHGVAVPQQRRRQWQHMPRHQRVYLGCRDGAPCDAPN